MINGSDSTGFPPFREQSGSMFTFSSDICRSTEVFFTETVTYKGITGYRYEISDNFLSNIGPEYGNECFCTGTGATNEAEEDNCLLRGALNLYTCQGKNI